MYAITRIDTESNGTRAWTVTIQLNDAVVSIIATLRWRVRREATSTPGGSHLPR